MIRLIADHTFDDSGARYIEAVGLSTDDKPVQGIITGSFFKEVDTGIDFLYDEESRVWIAQNTGNGKISIAGAVVTLGDAPTYDGTQKTQTVASVKIGSTTLTANTDYTVSENAGISIGSYELLIVGIGSYAGALRVPWHIDKGVGAVSASPDSLSLTAGGDAGASTLSITGDGAVSVASSATAVASVVVDGTTVTVTPLTEGSATITVTLAGTDHYSGDTATISVTVAADDNNGDG